MAVSEHTIVPRVARPNLEIVSRFGNAQIWIKDLDNLTTDPAEIAWLSKSERARATRLKDPTESLRFLASRIFTRKVLASVADLHPSTVEILIDKCGRPRLAQSSRHGSLGSSRLEFSVSHSENVLCIAIGQDQEIGVDVEVVRPCIDLLSVSKTALDPESCAIIERSSSEERLLTFYRLWTKREAFAKMQGHGICSDHVQQMHADSWQFHILDFTVGEKRVVGSLAVCPPVISRTLG
jgi:4'-phosphopantetheinyl transferase